MLQARPLYDTEADSRLFVEPSGWERLAAAVEHRFNVALIAPRGAGKTTALRQLQRRLRTEGVRVAYVDATQVEDVEQLVTAIERELVSGSTGDDTAGAPGGAAGSTSLRLIRRIRALADVPRTVVLVDCTHAAPAAHTLFGRLRDELWQLEHQWVVAVEDGERSVLLAPPADAFFEQLVTLSFTRDGLVELLRTREPALPDAVLQRIADTAPTARAALQATRDALTSPEGDDPLAATLWRREAAAAIGRPHGMAMAELESLGGASASDEELLRRLGWTRARAAQVLGALAEHELVTATDEKNPAGGRPRRVYRPAASPNGTAPSTRGTQPAAHRR
jgi:hypothetical protein